MTRADLQAWLGRAIHQGLLPAGTSLPPNDTRPWPVMLLVALGAWLAALPLLAVVGLLLGDWVTEGPGTYLIGALVLTAALVTLRSAPLPVFVEQLALPALLVGGGALVAGLFRDAPLRAAAVLSALLVIGVAALLPRRWLRVLLGALAALFFVSACLPREWDLFLAHASQRVLIALHAALMLWLVAVPLLPRCTATLRRFIEPLLAGWALALLAGLAAWSGQAMFVGAATASLPGSSTGTLLGWWRAGPLQAMPLLSLALGLAAAGWAAWRWPTLRRAWCAAAALPLVVLAAFMPALGAVLLTLVVCATRWHWPLATTAGVTAGWIVGGFYYQLAWPLQDKALVLLAAGAALGAIAWWAMGARRETAAVAATAAPAGAAHWRWGVMASAAAVVVVANFGIWQKERLIANGRPLLVELRPVDPRSLMQGDFMALAFALPAEPADPAPGLLVRQRPRVWARADERGVAQLRRPDPERARAADEIEIELTPRGGGWTLVTDAWFFAEGEGQRWAAARYGEFRVDAGGRALLVGLRGADLKPL
jgi:uncharacterized membrane-anchored protein